mmetsp:Transcript_3947/g.7586  ORF Transcript_3947/g.7586 Transcript_3947/m.7586 type:complete len:324 (-) Transcript_3947:308-1279(-)
MLPRPRTRSSPRRKNKEDNLAATSNSGTVMTKSTAEMTAAPTTAPNASSAGASTSVPDNTTKCSYKKCTLTTSDDAPSCVGPNCNKKIHMSCFDIIHSKLSWLNKEEVGDGIVVCGKTCWTKYKAVQSRKPTWANDGKDGPSDPMTSETILLDWLMDEENYSKKWHGKDSKGKKKKHVAAEIAQLMNVAKVKVHRDAKQVANKIAHIEKSFRCAHDFANSETGQGLKESDCGVFEDAVRKKCPFYHDILDIFGDRASAKPKATSVGNLESSDEENDEDFDVFLIADPTEIDFVINSIVMNTSRKTSKIIPDFPFIVTNNHRCH